MVQPIKKYRMGQVSLSVWNNEVSREIEGKTVKSVITSYSVEKSYKDANDEWQNTQSLGVSDLAKLSVLINKALLSATKIVTPSQEMEE